MHAFLSLAYSRLSDGGEDGKVKGTRTVGGKKEKGSSLSSSQFPPVLFSC